jgi:E3 ubiquitin-protein ligase RNF115/126
VLASLLGAIGDHPGQRTPGAQTGQPSQQPQINPLAALFAAVLNPDLARHGDFVYTQEALDRIISQLMEQNATGNAPGPATAEAITALPKKKVSIEMLGPDGRAECSICMDEVNVGDEVTELPCHHWFHQQCVGMWLGEHDTCPHCRKGIMDHSKHDENTTSSSQGSASGSGGPSNHSVSSSNRTTRIPGSFGAVGSGTAEDLLSVPENREQQREHEQQAERPGSNGQQSSSSATSDASGGSISERIRRGLFGAPR